MITLHVFGPMFGLPDASPFCTKSHVLLKMAGLDYLIDMKSFNKAPKGKLPYITDDGKDIADSTFIRWHIEEKYGFDFDQGLHPAQRATAWAFEKLCEDHIYWAIVHERWLDDRNFNAGPALYFDAAPAFIRPLVKAKVRRDMRRTLHGQGFGRHSTAERSRIAASAITALANQLGDQPFLMGAEPCGADAMVWACVQGLLCKTFTSPSRIATESHSNLVAYAERGRQRWFADATVV